MRARLQNIWENVSSGLWFVPTLLVLLAVGASSLLIEADAALAARNDPVIPWLFSGTADAARTVLSVIASSLITVISIAFSITIVALQQASAQFTPRVLRQFTASRSNQIVLGVYTATFVYALLVLRAVRSQTEGLTSAFVPALSVTVAIGLALLCLGLLIFFIHQMSRALQVAVILEHVHGELVAQLDALYPARGVTRADAAPEQRDRRVPVATVAATRAGFVRRIDEDGIRNLPLHGVRTLQLQPRVGQFVAQGGPLAAIEPPAAATAELAAQIREAVVIDTMPSINQDPLFGIRQLVDIALKALSPGINDMTTAEYALYHLGDALGRLADRSFPATAEFAANHTTAVIFNRPGWDHFVDASFSQIRHASAGDAHVTATLLSVLHGVALRVGSRERGHAVRHQVQEIRYSVETEAFSAHDRATLLHHAAVVEAALEAGTDTSLDVGADTGRRQRSVR